MRHETPNIWIATPSLAVARKPLLHAINYTWRRMPWQLTALMPLPAFHVHRTLVNPDKDGLVTYARYHHPDCGGVQCPNPCPQRHSIDIAWRWARQLSFPLLCRLLVHELCHGFAAHIPALAERSDDEDFIDLAAARLGFDSSVFR